nr:hypothetical protein [Tanacetum cinerariifolium]
KQHQHEVNEIRAERIAHVANPLALVAQKQPFYHPQTHPTHYTQNSSTRSQQAATRNRGKAIVSSPQPIYDQEPSMVAEDDETSKDKEIDKLMALISLSSAGYENQRISNVAGARETVEEEVIGQEEEGSKRKRKSSEQRAVKNQRIDEEIEELKTHLQNIDNNDDDMYTEATPLALKVLIVDYQIHHEHNKPIYKIIKADGTHQLFLCFITLLKNFDREDLEMPWKLFQKDFNL